MTKHLLINLKSFLPLVIGLTLTTGFKFTAPVVNGAVCGVDLRAGRQVEYVFICRGPKSLVYHASEECRGLSRCSTKVDKVTISDAIRMGRRPCKIEYK